MNRKWYWEWFAFAILNSVACLGNLYSGGWWFILAAFHFMLVLFYTIVLFLQYIKDNA